MAPQPPSPAPASEQEPYSSGGEDEGGPACWICLGGASEAPLGTPCACPRPVHAQCLARWQLQQAGRPEERRCRFCGDAYGDWREALSAGPGLLPATPVMAVNVRGRVHKLRVHSGPEGKELFRRQ
ncbi:hypothetical protein MNEG_11925, partial [Monoraphidium neglectum]